MTQTSTPFIPTVPAATLEVGLIRQAAVRQEFELATILERQLWEGVLEAIASGNAQAGYLAAAALESRDIEFPRA